MGKFFNGRILVTDYTQDDGNTLSTAIGNIINHPSSRAAVYVLLKDFKSVPAILKKFPTVISVVVDPLLDLDDTRKILHLLPRMDHYVNFLGDQVAQELLARRESFRIKTVPLDYITDSQRIIDKVLDSDGQQGIIFNASNNSGVNCLDALAQETSSKAIKKKTKKFFSKLSVSKSKNEGTSSEKEQLLPKECDSKSQPSTSARGLDRQNPSECDHVNKSSFWDLLVSVLCFCCPCFKSLKNVPLPPSQYPPDLDDQMQAALQQLHIKADEKWNTKFYELRDKRSNAFQELETKIEEWKKKELPNAMKKYDDDNKRTEDRSFDPKLKQEIVNSRHNRAVADVSRRSRELLQQGKLEVESEYDVDELSKEHYQYVLDKQLYKLRVVWQNASGAGCFG